MHTTSDRKTLLHYLNYFPLQKIIFLNQNLKYQYFCGGHYKQMAESRLTSLTSPRLG